MTQFPPMPDWFPDLAREIFALSPAERREFLRELNAKIAEDEARADAAKQKRQKRDRPRNPTLASVAKQASKAALAVARYEVRPDGTVVVVPGKAESTETNPWLDDLKVTKQ